MSNSAGGTRENRGLNSNHLLLAAGAFAFIALAGYWWFSSRYETLMTSYGQRRGPEHAASVNGTGVFAQMLAKAGHRVSSSSHLSPRTSRADVIVWTPSDFGTPSEDARDYFHGWLSLGQKRKLILIGRDYDAALRYWQEVRASASPDKVERIERELAFAEGRFEQARAKVIDGMYVEWFNTQARPLLKKAEQLGGPWAEGIDAKKANIELGHLFVPPVPPTATAPPAPTPAPATPAGAGKQGVPKITLSPPDPRPELSNLKHEVLLESAGEPIITRVTSPSWSSGEVILVQNGSFLLNYPLVNHEHRKLAGKMLAECSSANQIVFLESTTTPDIIEAKEQENSNPFRILTVWPINVLLLHATVIGILYCFCRAPIFGRPRTILAESVTDFGKHVAALGKLFGRGKDRRYAQERVQNYRELAQSHKGRSRLRATDDHGKHTPGSEGK